MEKGLSEVVKRLADSIRSGTFRRIYDKWPKAEITRTRLDNLVLKLQDELCRGRYGILCLSLFSPPEQMWWRPPLLIPLKRGLQKELVAAYEEEFRAALEAAKAGDASTMNEHLSRMKQYAEKLVLPAKEIQGKTEIATRLLLKTWDARNQEYLELQKKMPHPNSHKK